MKKVLFHLEYILILPISIIAFIYARTNLLLWAVGATFLLQAIAYILLAFNKHKLDIASGIINFVNGALATVILLLFAVSESPHKLPLYFLIYNIGYFIYKIFTIIYYANKKNDFRCTIYKEYGLVMLMFVINLIACMLLFIYSESENLAKMLDTMYNIFVNNYKEYDTFKFVLIIIKIVINFIASNVIAYFSASSLVLLIKNKPLTLKAKIRFIIEFIQKYYIGFGFVEFFSIMMCINYILQGKNDETYYSFALFYFLVFVLRTFIFVWTLVNRKKHKEDPYIQYKLNFILLIIVSATFLISTQAINTVLLNLSIKRNTTDSLPMWWLFMTVLPFSGYIFVNALLTFRRAKIEDNSALLAESNLSFITSLFTLFGAVMYLVVSFDETVRYYIWVVLISIVISLNLYILIKSLIIGIKGVAGKRRTREDFIKLEEELEEEIEEEKNEISA